MRQDICLMFCREFWPGFMRRARWRRGLNRENLFHGDAGIDDYFVRRDDDIDRIFDNLVRAEVGREQEKEQVSPPSPPNHALKMGQERSTSKRGDHSR